MSAGKTSCAYCARAGAEAVASTPMQTNDFTMPSTFNMDRRPSRSRMSAPRRSSELRICICPRRGSGAPVGRFRPGMILGTWSCDILRIFARAHVGPWATGSILFARPPQRRTGWGEARMGVRQPGSVPSRVLPGTCLTVCWRNAAGRSLSLSQRGSRSKFDSLSNG